MSEAEDTKKLPANFDACLIDLVKTSPLLYAKEKRVKPYESFKEKSEIWRNIATSLGVEPNFCMIRWKQLREKYRREIQQQHKPLIFTDPLMEKMGFLNTHANFSHKQVHTPGTTKTPKPNDVEPISKAEQIFGGVNYEYLPEAMEAQSSTNDTTTKAMPNAMYYMPGSTNSVLVRIKALLEGLDAENRVKAEKRVLSYLCKCQLKSLENESIDDICF